MGARGENLSNTAQLLQQDLQTQLNACIIRFEYDISQRLGQYTLQKLQGNGLDLLRSGREALLDLVNRIHQTFGLGQGLHHLEFQWHADSHCDADRPEYVEAGYIYLYLSERSILGYFLQQKACYKAMLELLTDHVIRYMEKVYYRIEQHWQEFQSHFMALESQGSSHNVSLGEEHELENPATEYPQATAAQIAQRHRRIQQLQAITRSFWQDNFAAALGQLHLDLPNWQDGTEMLPDIEQGQAIQQQHLIFAPYYMALLKELESLCNLAQQRQNLQFRLRRTLEQSFDGFPLQVQATSNEVRYTEYPEESIWPDEQAKLSLRYAAEQWLQQWQTHGEERFIALSKQIHDFFAKVEKATRFRWLYMGIRALVPKLSRTQQAEAATGLPEKNAALEELLQKPNLSPFGHNLGYETRLLVELLQRADLALLYQLPFRPRHYELQKQLQQLRRNLLNLCHQPLYTNDLGIQITACYRTVRKRRETFRRLEKILQDFCTNCQLWEL